MRERIGPYEIVSQLGQGGMGVVYKALQPSVNRTVALKVLPQNLEADEVAVRRFRQEAETAANLRHENIVKVWDASVDTPPYYMAMEFLEGGTLADRLKPGPLTLEEAATVLASVCSALDYAHERGVVHRDIKPGNILFDASGKAVVTDFGIARGTERTRLTVTGSAFGTPDYMSPEQARGQSVDARSDLYAVGVLLYEMLTGRPPFSGDPLTVLYQIVHADPPNALDIQPDLPAVLGPVLRKALAREPDDRYQSGGELVEAVRASMQPSAVAEPPMDGPAKARARIPPMRRRRVLGGALAGVLGLAATVVWCIWWSGRPPHGPHAVARTTANDVAEPESAEEVAPPPTAANGPNVGEPPVGQPDRGSAASRRVTQPARPSPQSDRGRPTEPAPGAETDEPGLQSTEGTDVSDVVGKPLARAEQILWDAGFTRKLEGYEDAGRDHVGLVLRQNPKGGAPADRGASVSLWVGGVSVPRLVGLTEGAAREKLQDKRLALRSITSVSSDRGEDGRIVEQDPQAGTVVCAGTQVDVWVAKPGPPGVPVPKVVGLELKDAQSALLRAKLKENERGRTYASDWEIAEDYVIGQDPKAGTWVPEGTGVSLVVSNGVPDIPRVAGLAPNEAKRRLERDGFYLGKQTREPHETVPRDHVTRQDPPAGPNRDKARAVDVWISSGPPLPPPIPCPIRGCDKTFSTKERLKQHLRAHTERVCPFCQMPFQSGDELANHLLNTHFHKEPPYWPKAPGGSH
jgi:beta-lactam-binding protein with PASTA domain